jgi:hypothetical protein
LPKRIWIYETIQQFLGKKAGSSRDHTKLEDSKYSASHGVQRSLKLSTFLGREKLSILYLDRLALIAFDNPVFNLQIAKES